MDLHPRAAGHDEGHRPLDAGKGRRVGGDLQTLGEGASFDLVDRLQRDGLHAHGDHARSVGARVHHLELAGVGRHVDGVVVGSGGAQPDDVGEVGGIFGRVRDTQVDVSDLLDEVGHGGFLRTRYCSIDGSQSTSPGQAIMRAMRTSGAARNGSAPR